MITRACQTIPAPLVDNQQNNHTQQHQQLNATAPSPIITKHNHPHKASTIGVGVGCINSAVIAVTGGHDHR
eukprot:scaffold511_cov62-Cyclotella_meneghiniana.AAC.4